MVTYTVTTPTGKKARLTKSLRDRIREARGEGYTLPDSLMYTYQWGIVPNTERNRRKFSPATVIMTDSNIPGQRLFETMSIRFSDMQKQQMNGSYSDLRDILPENDYFASAEVQEPPQGFFAIRNRHLVFNAIRKAILENPFTVYPFRPVVDIYLVSYNNQTERIFSSVESEGVPPALKNVATPGFNLTDHVIEEVNDTIDRFLTIGYVLPMWIYRIDIRALRYRPAKGGSYFPFCKKIQSKRCVVNVQNKDELCVLWSFLASEHPQPSKSERTSNYAKYMPALMEKCANITFPIAPANLDKLEPIFGQKINVYTVEDNAVVPVRFTAQEGLNLYFEKQGNQAHYGWIKNMSRLLSGNTKTNHNKVHFCLNCLQSFYSESALAKHRLLCNQPGKTILPAENSTLEYKNDNRSLWQPMVVYGDFEAINRKTPKTVTESTHIVTTHTPCSFGAYISTDAEIDIPHYYEYCGQDTGREFIHYLFGLVLPERNRLIKLNSIEKNACPVCKEPNTPESVKGKFNPRVHRHCLAYEFKSSRPKSFYSEDSCWLCSEAFSDPLEVRDIFTKSPEEWSSEEKKTVNMRKVYDHCHLTGLPRGPDGKAALHQICNLKLQDRRNTSIPVIFHNLKNYDANFIMRSVVDLLHDEPEWCENVGLSVNTFQCIATSMEKFKTFSIGPFKFLDSYAFLASSLSTLMSQLLEFPHMKANELDATNKGICPYEWLDSFEKLDAKMPTDPSAYYSSLSETITATEEEIRQTLHFPDVKSYLLYYQKIDVIGLADVFDTFRHRFFAEYRLDPCNFISLPQLSFACMLKTYNKPIGLISDPDMYLTFEQGIRGGISYIGKRYSLETNDCKQIMLDINNLYGWAMRQPLPCGNFTDSKFLKLDYIKALTLSPKAKRGCALTVDLEYPEELWHRDAPYPLAEVHRTPDQSDFSEYQIISMPEEYKPCRKLMSDFKPRIRYTVHYRNLQFYIQQGLKVTKVHKIIWFDQEPLMRKFIDTNTAKRAKAVSKFEQDLKKLENNSVFGKSMESVRGRTKVKFCDMVRFPETQQKHQNNTLLRYVNDQISPHLVINIFQQPCVKQDKPIAIGFTILELSKLLMHTFYYEAIDHFGRENIDVLMTDTDSLCLEIKTKDLDADLARSDFYKRFMDCSNYDVSHPLYHNLHKKEVGYMKNEYPEGIAKFVGLASKCYHITRKDKKQVVKGKGINAAARYKLNADDFESALFEMEDTYVDLHNIRANHFHINTIKSNKKALTAFDDKRRIAPDGINTFPYS